MDPRPESVDLKVSAEKILNIFMQEKCDHIVALDACYLALIKPIEDELKELGLQSVIVVSSNDQKSHRVKILQELLNSVGYELEVDGDFGELTEKAWNEYVINYLKLNL